MTIRDVMHVRQVLFIADNMTLVALPLLRIAILLDWTRMIASEGRNVLPHIMQILVFTQVCHLGASVLTLDLGCRPLTVFWDPTVLGRCIDMSDFLLAMSGIDFGFDLILLLFSQLFIWRLSPPCNQKLGVLVVFSFGCL